MRGTSCEDGALRGKNVAAQLLRALLATDPMPRSSLFATVGA